MTAAPRDDRPPPGHYQRMLGAILASHPVVVEVSPQRPTLAGAERRVRVHAARRRSGQLPLPLESSGAVVVRAPR